MFFTLVVFLAILAVLVISHEFGHFIAARKSGMKVYEFGFGFPPRLIGIQFIKDANGKSKLRFIGRKKTSEAMPRTEPPSGSGTGVEEEDASGGGTIYSLNLIPLGGFVRIKGEEGQETGPDSFVSKPAWQKAITLAAGVTMNIILAWVLLSIGFGIGIPQPVEDARPGMTVKDRNVQIVQVMSGKPADLAGLKPGDIFLAVGELVNPELKAMQDYMDAHKNETINLKIKRGDEIFDKTITTFVYEDTGHGGLGVAIVDAGLVSYPWHKAIWYGFLATGAYLKEILVSFYLLFKGLFSGAAVGEALSGPVGIAVLTGQVAKMGFAYLLNFTALLSLNLAIINILPIPALDGGRLLFLAISKIIRRPLSQKYEQLAHTLGFVALMILVVLVTIKDLGNFKGFFIDLWNNII